MKEMPVAAGESIVVTVHRLVAKAPAFCVFNDIRLVAEVGATYDSVIEQYHSESQKRVKEQEEREAAETKKRTANWIWAIRKNERARVVQRIRELLLSDQSRRVEGILQQVEREQVSEDEP